MIKIINLTLIYNNQETRGEGTKESPVRRLTQLYTEDGELLMEYDVHKPNGEQYINPEVIEFLVTKEK